MTTTFKTAVPILRIFSEELARKFYVDYLGMKVDWEHRFEPNTPVYMQVSRGEFVLHLSGHYGDGVPGTAIYVEIEGIQELHKDLRSKTFIDLRPEIEEMPWNAYALNLIDPFGNRLRLNERKSQ